jgi:hypothetical protein
VVWTIPSPWRFRTLGAARLVSTPSRQSLTGALGSGLPVTGFPEFGQFCTFGFPEGTQVA